MIRHISANTRLGMWKRSIVYIDNSGFFGFRKQLFLDSDQPKIELLLSAIQLYYDSALSITYRFGIIIQSFLVIQIMVTR